MDQTRAHWIFLGNASSDGSAAELVARTIDLWDVEHYTERFRPGDIVWFWDSSGASIFGWGRVLSGLLAAEKEDLRISVRIEEIFASPIDIAALEDDRALANLEVLSDPKGANFAVTLDEAEALVRLVTDRGLPAPAPEPVRHASPFVEPSPEAAQLIEYYQFRVELVEPLLQTVDVLANLFVSNTDEESLVPWFKTALGGTAARPYAGPRDNLFADAGLQGTEKDPLLCDAGLSEHFIQEASLSSPTLSVTLAESFERVFEIQAALGVPADDVQAENQRTRALLAALLFGDLPAVNRLLDLLQHRPTIEELRVGFLEATEKHHGAEEAERWVSFTRTDPEQGPSPDFLVASLNADNPFARPVEEPSSIDADARSFAALAAARSLAPPLSIGVFGHWGAGKSFFMARMHQFVEQLAKQDEEGRWFHNKIVQIRFNAWHYMETNLWASLVEHIFTELDRWLSTQKEGRVTGEDLLGRLNTARTQQLHALAELAQKRKEAREATGRLKTARTAHQNAKRKLATLTTAEITKTTWVTLGEVIGGNEESRQRIAEAAAALGVAAIKENVEAFRKISQQLATDVGRAKLLWQGTLPLVRRRFALLVAAFVLVGLVALLPMVRDWLSERGGLEWVGGIRDGAIWLATSLGAVAGYWRLMSKPARRALDTLEQFRVQLDETRRRVDSETSDTLRALEQAEFEASGALVAARDTNDKANAQRQDAERAYHQSTARSRLNFFIHAKVRDSEYAKHLGIVSSIRKDFGQLTQLMSGDEESDEAAKQAYVGALEDYADQVDRLEKAFPCTHDLTKEEIEELKRFRLDTWDANTPEPFRRVILYVDDLDRCPADKVVEVLQAIHLLLYFKLFVVVVAVDARWVSRSLREEYPSLLDETVMLGDAVDGGDVTHERGTASSHDYLEKIFQLPYWVQPMSDKASGDYTVDLIQKGRKAVAATAISPSRGAAPPQMAAEQTGKEQPVEKSSLSVEPVPVPSDDLRSRQETMPGERSQDSAGVERRPARAPPSAARLAEQMEVSDDEQDLLEAFSRFAGRTPRRILRFVNAYRVAKTCRVAHGDQPGASPVTLRALTCQLAIATGAPELAHQVADYFVSNRASGVNLAQVRKALAQDDLIASHQDWPRVAAALDKLLELEQCDDGNSEVDYVREMADVSEVTTRYGFVAR